MPAKTKPKRQRFYWDTCLVIAWLKDEVRLVPEEMHGLKRVMAAHERGDVLIITSIFTDLEILPSSLPPEAEGKLEALRARPEYFPMQEVTGPIIRAARALRVKATEEKKWVSLQDSIHLASAMAWGVDALHTFDGTGNKKKAKKLIPLSGLGWVEGLKICRPDFQTPTTPTPPPNQPNQRSLLPPKD